MNRVPLLTLLVAASACAQQFEVASVKVVPPGQLGAFSEKITVSPTGVTMRNVRLRGLIKWAYDVKEYQVSGPAWMGSPGWQGRDLTRYEVAAKAPEGTTPAQLRAMMQALLAERFHLSVHRETRDVPVLVMTAAKPKSGMKSSSADEPGVQGDAAGLLLSGATMAEFAELMAGPLHVPIVDRTGLTGRFDFRLSGQLAPGDDGASAMMADIEQQLGLKLQRDKAAIEMLVVDRADQKPTEN